MGLRIRKTIGKGAFRMTFSKSGISTSIGGKGARFTKTANGRTRSTLSIPGTGIGYTTETGKKGKNYGAPQTTSPDYSSTSISLRPFFKVMGIFTIIASLLLCLAVPVAGIIGLIIGIVEVVLSSKKKAPTQDTQEDENFTK